MKEEPFVALMTIADFAERLGLSQICVRKWIANGKVNAYKVGDRSVRIPRTELTRIVRGVVAKSSK